jgi:4,5-dihydroxyphthalate decarboxylase
MAQAHLTIALSHYDRHIPFFGGSVVPEGIDLRVLEVGESKPLKDGADRHARMLQQGEFDIAELSLSSYLMAKSRGMPFTAVPVFPRRLFSLSQMWVNVNADIDAPKDLIGRKVGLSTFQTTMSVLAKGDLQAEYDVPWRKVYWHVAKGETIPFKVEEGVSIEPVAKGKNIADALDRGEIDALIIPQIPQPVVQGSDRVRRLFPRRQPFITTMIPTGRCSRGVAILLKRSTGS